MCEATSEICVAVLCVAVLHTNGNSMYPLHVPASSHLGEHSLKLGRGDGPSILPSALKGLVLGVEVAAELLYIAGVGASVPLNAPGESLDLHWDERGKQPGVVKVYFAGLLERTTLCDLHRGLERFALEL